MRPNDTPVGLLLKPTQPCEFGKKIDKQLVRKILSGRNGWMAAGVCG